METSTRLPAFLGLTGVTLGAFGAHYLKSRLTEDGLKAWGTAVQYQLIHAAVMLAIVGLRASHASNPHRLDQAYALMGTGTVLFSGSIYALVLGGPRLLGPVTPLGGLFMMAGWAALAFSGK